jgi:two-component system, NtrC family, response regulator
MAWNVLVVDDEPEICRTLKNYLALSGYNVLTANSGQEALEIAKRQKIHVVLSDIKMPGMDGLELLEKMREHDFSTQVIMMTGFSTFQITLRALEKGATDYVLKPFEDMDQIVKLVNLAAEKLGRWKRNLAESVRQNQQGE